MAQAPDFAQYTESVSPTFQPVSSRAGLIAAGATENLAESAAGMFKSLESYQRGSVLEEVRQGAEALSEQYIRNSPTHLGEIKSEIQSLQDDLSNLAEPTPGQEDLYKQNILSINKKIAEKTSQLENAYSQGVIDEFQFKKRLGLLFKETSNTNPFFKEEIKSTINDVLYANSMSERIKLDQKYIEGIAKEQEHRIKRIDAGYSKHDLGYVYTTDANGRNIVDYDASEAKLQQFLLDTEAANRVKLTKGRIQDMDDTNILIAEQRGTFKQLIRGTFNNMVIESISQLNSGAPWATQKMAIEGIIRKYQIDINEQLQGRPDNPIIQSHAKFFKDQSDSLLKSIIDSGSGESAKTFLVNKREGIEAQQQIGVMNEINLAALDAHSKLTKTLTDVQLLNLPGGQDILTKGMTFLSRGVDTSDNGLNLYIRKENSLGTTIPDKMLFFSGEEVAKQSLGTKTENYNTFVKEFENNILKHSAGLNELEAQGKYLEKSSVQTRMFITFADPKLKGAFNDVSPDGKTAVQTQFKDYTNIIYKNLDSFIKQNPNAQINLTVLDDGTLVADGKGVSKDFNSTIVSRVNTSLKAYANLQNKSTADVAKEFYGTYFNNLSTLGTEPTPSGQPAKKSKVSATGGEDWSTWNRGMTMLLDQPDVVRKAVDAARSNNTPLAPDLLKVAKYLDKQDPGFFDKGVTGSRNTSWLRGQKD